MIRKRLIFAEYENVERKIKFAKGYWRSYKSDWKGR